MCMTRNVQQDSVFILRLSIIVDSFEMESLMRDCSGTIGVLTIG